MNLENLRDIAYEYGRKKALNDLKKYGKVKNIYKGKVPKKYKDFDLAFSVSAFEGYTSVYYEFL